MALNWISSRAAFGIAPHWYRAGPRQLERTTGCGVGMGGRDRDVPGHGRRAAALSTRLSSFVGRCRLGSELRVGDRRRCGRRTADDHSAGGDTRARVWRRGRSRQRPTNNHDHPRCVLGRDRQRPTQTICDGVVDAVRRRPSAGVSAVCRLDVGALRSRFRDGVARTADRCGGVCVDGPRGYCLDRHDRATATPSQAAAARWGLNRVRRCAHHLRPPSGRWLALLRPDTACYPWRPADLPLGHGIAT